MANYIEVFFPKEGEITVEEIQGKSGTIKEENNQVYLEVTKDGE